MLISQTGLSSKFSKNNFFTCINPDNNFFCTRSRTLGDDPEQEREVFAGGHQPEREQVVRHLADDPRGESFQSEQRL